MTGSRTGGRGHDGSAAEPPSASPDYQHALDTAWRLLGQPLVLPLGSGEPALGADFRRLSTVHLLVLVIRPLRTGFRRIWRVSRSAVMVRVG